ncbi:MAG: phosphate/phosphite/phosphonate ABC transporter substrate-binding protein, partial [bacterium]
MKKITGIMAAGLILLLIFTAGCGNEIPDQRFDFSRLKPRTDRIFTIGEVPSHSIVEMLRRREKFKQYLTKHLNMEVQFRFAASYKDIIKEMENQKFDMAVLGPLAYVQAAERTDYSPLVRPVRYGSPSYRAIIFTHAQSGIKSIPDLRGRTMAFVDPNSTSGYLFPRGHMIRNFDLSPEKDLGRISFVGGHDRVVEMVNKQQFAAGATYEGARMEIFDDSAQADQQLPVLARTQPIPSEPIVISSKIQADEKLH